MKNSKFSTAIVRKPCKNFVHGLTTADLGNPDYDRALDQHHKYIAALRHCGLNVTVLPAQQSFPDSVFIEDVAVLTSKCAIITNPGAPTRKGEITGMYDVLSAFYKHIESIIEPGTVDGGDVLMAGSHFYIGLSQRTNRDGARQLINILEKYGFSGSLIRLAEVLHLKTGVAYLEDNNLIAAGEFIKKQEFKNFNIIAIPDYENYAANCLWLNGTVLLARGFPETRDLIKTAGYNVIELDVSEFQKLDGGLSCLSLRF